MRDRIRFMFNRLKEHLWVKPLVICILSVIVAFLAKFADHVTFFEFIPEVSLRSLNAMLSITSGSMLGVATFAIGSMLTAYGFASSTATPRSFPLILADDVSQNALSSFIGAFIFSIVAIVALENGYYGNAGRFFLFLMAVIVFAVIIFNFIRWLDRIARLGRLGNTIEKVEQVAKESLLERKHRPTLGAKKAVGQPRGIPIYTKTVGYVQRIDLIILQNLAQEYDLQITIVSPPGTFTFPNQPLAYVKSKQDLSNVEGELKRLIDAFIIAKDRAFDEDPRFGLVVLSEIASRALSAAVNDPGTAIDIIGSFVRLFSLWAQVDEEDIDRSVKFDRISLPELSMNDLFNDAFNVIARDGAGAFEVELRLQEAFRSLMTFDDADMKREALSHAKYAFRHAQTALVLEEEKAHVNTIVDSFVKSG